MGAECCKSRKMESVGTECCKSHKMDTVLLQTAGSENNIPSTENDGTQQLLPHKTPNEHNLSYLSMGSTPHKKEDNDHYKFPQTPPIIKALFGSDNDQELKDTQENNETPMGLRGDVYLGFASNDEAVVFQTEDRDNIIRQDIDNIDSTSSASPSPSCSSDDWTSTPHKSSLLMGFADEHDTVSYQDFDVMFACNKDARNPCTLSNMSLNSAHLADMVITGVKALTPRKQQMPWIIATFNVFIEYFPYKHIMEEIFVFCNVDISAVGFEFPNTADLDSQYNYYDAPDLYIENVSSTDKHQPCLVLMIGAPGSGKTSYATYRYGKQCVVAADDYFEIHYAGNFVGSDLKQAHAYCQQQVLTRLYKKETVVVANTHSTFWQLYDKIMPVLFDDTLSHKIVFAVMPETNATTLVRRCMHSCTKPKIINYVQSIGYMLSDDGMISTDKVLIYGDAAADTYTHTHTNYDTFDWGLWIDAEGYRSVQDWYQHYSNTNLRGDLGDGRISPIIEDSWSIFKKTFQKWIDLSKFDSENDPVIDMEVRVIGYTKHRISQMVALEIIKPASALSGHNEIQKAFWRMFEAQINMDTMGCVLSMRRGIPFNTAKYLFEYNCIQYIKDGPIVKAKLATKRYVRNYIQYYTPPPPIHPTINAHASNNMFFNLEGVHVISSNNKAIIDKSSFSLKLREKHCNHNGKLLTQNGSVDLNPNAEEFKMEEKSISDSLNPTAIEFKPQQMIQTHVQGQWFPPPTATVTDINFMLQQQQLLLQCIQPIPTQNIQNIQWNTTANEFKPQQPLQQPLNFASIGTLITQQTNNNNGFQAQQQEIDYSKMAAYADMQPTHFPLQPQQIIANNNNNRATYMNVVPNVPLLQDHNNNNIQQ